MATEYKLSFTAEEIEERLSIVNPSRNLLTYPYTEFSQLDGFNIMDNGDGSVSIEQLNTSTVGGELELSTVTLEAGTYIANVNSSHSQVKLFMQGDTANLDLTSPFASQTITITEATTFTVYLSINPTTSLIKGCTVKPQIEKGTVASEWRPFLSSVTSYVDSRFNNTLKRLNNKLDNSDLDTAVNEALLEAKNSGTFDGRGITSANIDLSGHLVINYDDNTSTRLGQVVGDSASISAEEITDGYMLHLTNTSGAGGSFLTSIQLRHGKDGAAGEQGPKGDAFTFDDFTSDQLESLRGPQGEQGLQGEQGKDGYTPVKGTDYFTTADKTELVTEVKAGLKNDLDVLVPEDRTIAGIDLTSDIETQDLLEALNTIPVRHISGIVTSSFEGKLGELIVAYSNGSPTVYICSAVSAGSYGWTQLSNNNLVSFKKATGVTVDSSYPGKEGQIVYLRENGQYSFYFCTGVYHDPLTYEWIKLNDNLTEDQILDIFKNYLAENPIVGSDGKSAYEVALDNNFEGTEEEWLESLKGEKGDPGTSGVYVGSGDMPENCNVQIDPNGQSISVEEISTVENVLTELAQGIPLTDTETGQSYKLYVANGKLVMEIN